MNRPSAAPAPHPRTSAALHEALRTHPAMQRPLEDCSADELIARVEALKVVRAAAEQVDKILSGAA